MLEIPSRLAGTAEVAYDVYIAALCIKDWVSRFEVPSMALFAWVEHYGRGHLIRTNRSVLGFLWVRGKADDARKFFGGIWPDDIDVQAYSFRSRDFDVTLNDIPIFSF